MEIAQIKRMSIMDLHPASDEYINFMPWATLAAYQRDLLSLFVLMHWLRLLKYLRYANFKDILKTVRIPPFTGPMVQSISDTVKASRVIIFEVVIMYVVLTFAVTFHIAFGPDVQSFSNYGSSLYVPHCWII
jgi:hypothetical protein